MAGRTFDEQEVAEIFRLASSRQDKALRALSPGGGLTLEELKAIGEEAGISSTFIANAAQQVGRTVPASKRKRFMGLPVGFTRNMDLPATFDDQHWSQLVAGLHDELDVIGETRTDGDSRIWQSDIGQMVVEPAGEGYRLRLKLSQDALRGALMMSAALTFMGLFFMLVLATKQDLFVDLAKTVFVSMFSVAGLTGFGYSAFKSPRWVADRESQIDRVLDQLQTTMDTRHVTKAQTATVAASAAPTLDLDDPEPESVPNPARRKTRS